MRLLFVLLFGTTLLLAAPIPKEKPKVKDEEAILGKWEFDKIDSDGANTELPKEILDTMRVVFDKDGKMKVTIVMQGRNSVQELDYKIDAEAKLKCFDSTSNSKTTKGIYQLEGDVLKIASGNRPNSERPTEFKAVKASNVSVIVLKRVVEEKKDK